MAEQKNLHMVYIHHEWKPWNEWREEDIFVGVFDNLFMATQVGQDALKKIVERKHFTGNLFQAIFDDQDSYEVEITDIVENQRYDTLVPHRK